MAEFKEGDEIIANVDPNNGLELSDFDENEFTFKFTNMQGQTVTVLVDNTGTGGPVVRPYNPPS